MAQNKTIDSLQIILARDIPDTSHMMVYMTLANEFARKDFDKTKAYCYQALALSRRLKTFYALSGIYSLLTIAHQNTGRIDSAQHYLNQLKDISIQHPSLKTNYNYYTTAGLFYKKQGRYKEALPYMLEALNYSDPLDHTLQAGPLLNIGNTYKDLGEYKKAVDYQLQSLVLFEEAGNKRGQSFCLQNLGNNFVELGQITEAQKYYERSLLTKKELNDTRGILTAWAGLGTTSRQRGLYKEAIQYHTQSLTAAREMKLSLEESLAYFDLALVYKEMKNLSVAKENFLLSLDLAKQTADSARVAAIRVELNALETKEKQHPSARLLMHSLSASHASGDRPGEVKNYLLLSEFYAGVKQYDSAYHYIQKFRLASDSLTGRELQLQVKTLELQYNTVKKEKEIELLKKDQELKTLALSKQRTNVILIALALLLVVVISVLLVNRYRMLNRANRQVEMESIRNTIARDLHDDIGSTLSSINIMSQVALQENACLPDRQGNAGLHLKKIAGHSARLMEDMSDIVWSINPKNDTLARVMTKMKEFAAEILEPKNIGFAFHVEGAMLNLKLDVAKRKNIFLIFKEAINNAAKYSEASEITVTLLLRQEKFQLTVHDNGKGFDLLTARRGNGLVSMDERAVSIGAELLQTTKPGDGTRIHLNVPLV